MPDTIGALLRSIRKRRKMTLERLSELTGISVSSLSRIENTQLGLTVEKVDLLARALEIAPEDLIARNPGAVDRDAAGALPARANLRRLTVDRERRRGRKASSYRELNVRYLFEPDTERALECMQVTIESISVWDSEKTRPSPRKEPFRTCLASPG